MVAASPGVARRRRRPSLGGAAGVFIVMAGGIIGLRPLSDNSFFTHLATGRIILATGSVPSADPYTFTAHGADWLVQSWLASVLYASVEVIGGAVGLRLLMGTTAGVLVALAWHLTRPTRSLIPRLAIGALFVTVGAQLWSERPLMLGLIAMACVVVVVEGAVDPRWLVPVGWLWVNVHGSFPLGLVYVAVVVVGDRLDGEPVGRILRVLGWLLLGVVAGAAGPLGLAVLTFPIELLQRQDVLQHVIEWRAPTFDSLSQRAFLAQLVLVIVALVRRPSYRHGLVVAVFTGAALLGARNLPVASLLFLPLMAAAAPEWGSLRSTARTRVATVLGAAGVVAAVLLVSARLGQRDFELRGYPVDAIAFLDAKGIDLTRSHLASRDIVGNLLELVDGPQAEVFYDDRFDMFPGQVSGAHLALVQTSPNLLAELAQFDIDLVTWERTSPTGQRLIIDPAWRVLFTDESWVTVCRRGAELGGTVGSC